MGKISPVSAKYIIHTSIEIDGVVDKPDVIGAIFGQTEGLLGADLELRELQRSGRIGRIEVNVDTKSGKTKGEIIVPSSLDKAETSIIAAAFEIIQRIGPCNAKMRVHKIEDVRVSKRNFVVSRAKELLRHLMDTSMPDSQELAEEVAYSVRVMEIQEWGKDRLPCGPGIEESEDIIIVEGRADVLVLLKHGIKNAIAMNGTSVPPSLAELTKQKEVTVFVDGDRGGLLNIKELAQVASIDFVAKAPDGKEVEELAKKEIHQALRNKVSIEQVNLTPSEHLRDNKFQQKRYTRPQRDDRRDDRREPRRDDRRTSGREIREPREVRPRKPRMSDEEKAKFKSMLEDLIGSRGAYLVDDKMNILGKVPLSELNTTMGSIGSGIHAVIFDGSVEKDIVEAAEKVRVPFVIGMKSEVKTATRCFILTLEDLS